MKKGYKRLLYFEIFVFLILILNSFVWNILNRYTIIIFLIILLGIFKFFFGFEKDKHRYSKDVILETIIFFLVFFMMYYLFGIIIGFARTGNYYTFTGLKTFFLPIVFLIVLEEYLRYMVMCKAEGSRLLVGISIVMFIFLDVTISLYLTKSGSNYDKFIFLALTLLPAIARNVGFTTIIYKTGYKPLMLYQLVMNLYFYIFPIVPNPSEYLSSIIQLILPIVYCYKTNKFFNKAHDQEVDRDYKKNKVLPFLGTVIIVIVMVYFSSGYFHFWTIAVASDSMSPHIKKGDVVVIEKIDKNFSKLKKGDVVAFKYKNVVIVHRLINVLKEKDKYYFYTKGDANSKEDNFVIEEDDMIGEVNVKIPFIGAPTVWLNEL